MTAGIMICGCGWLGKHLAARACATMPVLGTTRSSDNTPALAALGIAPFVYSLGDDIGSITTAGSANTVVLNIPPGRKKPIDGAFVDQMTELIDGFCSANAKHIIFVSTTSVYGEEERLVREDTSVSPQTDSAKAHVAIEQHLRKHDKNHYSILRLGGLIGPNRHPITSMAGRTLVNGEKAVNLVHVIDVVAAILALEHQGGAGQTLHLCSSQHPKRGEYYTFSAQKLGLSPPQFNTYERLPRSGKIVDAAYSWQVLGVTPVYASPYDMI